MAVTPTVQKTPRQSNLELFRIIVMLLIVAHHYVVNSGLLEPMSAHPDSLRTLYYQIFGAWGKTGINCFICITAWFMCKSSISVQKVFKLLSQIYFYRFLFFIMFLLAGYENLSIKRLLAVISPIGMGIDYSFINCFIVFYLCIPFLNILIRNLDQKMHRRLVCLLLGVFTFATILPWFHILFNYVTWFSVLYVIIAYLRFYPNRFTESLASTGWVCLACILCSIASIVAFNVLARLVDVRFNNLVWFFLVDSNKVLAVATGISSFLFFKNLRISYSRIINVIASTIFGVLLIHANSDAMRQFIWIDLLRNDQFYYSPLFFLHSIVVVLGVFCVCSLFDYLRIKFIEPQTMKLYFFMFNKTQSRFVQT